MINKLVSFIYRHSNFFFLKTSRLLLNNILNDYDTILEIGPGRTSTILKIKKNLNYTGVEIYKPYYDLLQEEKNELLKYHKQVRYLNHSIMDLEFNPSEFDWIVLLDVLEHFEKDDALILLDKANNWTTKGIILSTPNGFVKQSELDGNPAQVHKSGWELQELEHLGFSVFGLAGLKLLRRDFHAIEWTESFFESMRWRPRFFWFLVATVSQYFTYNKPKYAFQFFAFRSK